MAVDRLGPAQGMRFCKAVERNGPRFDLRYNVFGPATSFLPSRHGYPPSAHLATLSSTLRILPPDAASVSQTCF